MTELSLQDQIPHNHCFGCAPRNEKGLSLRSYWSGSGSSVARFKPQAHHCAAPTHFVNGGIIATLIDCHCMCTATAAAYFRQHRPIGSDPKLTFATGRLSVQFLRPTPIDSVLLLSAKIERETPNGFVVQCQLSAQDKVCAQGEVEAVTVAESWGRSRRERSL